MSPVLAATVLAALVALCVVIGVVMRRQDGRLRDGSALRFDETHADGAVLGSTATLVQFSTELCARCPQARRLLTEVAAAHDGLTHVEVDLTHRPDLSSHYRVLQTPTVFLIDATGEVRARFNGVPRSAQLAEAIAAV